MSDPNYEKYAAQWAIDLIRKDKTIWAIHAETIWKAINNNNLNDEDTAYWCRLIAKDVVENVIEKRVEGRDDRALHSLKLVGSQAKTVTERMFVWSWLLIHAQDAPTNTIERDKRLLAAMQAAGRYDGVKVKNAMKRLKRLLQKD